MVKISSLGNRNVLHWELGLKLGEARRTGKHRVELAARNGDVTSRLGSYIT
jgi:hypothetical protein